SGPTTQPARPSTVRSWPPSASRDSGRRGLAFLPVVVPVPVEGLDPVTQLGPRPVTLHPATYPVPRRPVGAVGPEGGTADEGLDAELPGVLPGEQRVGDAVTLELELCRDGTRQLLGDAVHVAGPLNRQPP